MPKMTSCSSASFGHLGIVWGKFQTSVCCLANVVESGMEHGEGKRTCRSPDPLLCPSLCRHGVQEFLVQGDVMGVPVYLLLIFLSKAPWLAKDER